MKKGKILCSNKELEKLEIPTDRFWKRMDIFIFSEAKMGDVPHYLIGDIEDDYYPYWIPAKHIILCQQD